MNIKFNLDNELLLNKNSYHENSSAGAIYFEKDKCYSQVFFR